MSRIAVFLASAVLASVACADTPSGPQSLTKQVDDLFAPWTRSDSPGCSMATTQDGRIVLERGYGMADLEQGVSIRPDTVFNMASVSKQFTTTAILLLEQDGKLSLDDDVRKYVPELRDYGKKITLRHLGNHTSGLRDYPELLGFAGWNWVDEVPVQRALDLISRQKSLNFDPGAKYTYSNSGYILLAEIVRRTSGKTLGPFADERIFKPLGMLHSRFYDDRRMIMKNRAIGHYRDRHDGDRLSVWRPTYEVVGDGALLTTVQDMALWERNFVEPRLGRDPQKLIASLTQPARLNDGSAVDYAFGLGVDDYRGLHTVSHGGGIPGYATYMLRFPEQRFSVQVMCNQGGLPARNLAYSIADLYLEGHFKAPAPVREPRRDPAAAQKNAIALSKAKLAELAGRYYSEELDATHVLRVEGDALVAQVGYLPPERLVATRADHFESGDEWSVDFTRDGRGQITGFTLSTERITGLGFSRQP
jgi:CubicO group peptidase (beta-lactamase class C family)